MLFRALPSVLAVFLVIACIAISFSMCAAGYVPTRNARVSAAFVPLGFTDGQARLWRKAAAIRDGRI